jgi:hypothetical protein
VVPSPDVAERPLLTTRLLDDGVALPRLSAALGARLAAGRSEPEGYGNEAMRFRIRGSSLRAPPGARGDPER